MKKRKIHYLSIVWSGLSILSVGCNYYSDNSSMYRPYLGEEGILGDFHNLKLYESDNKIKKEKSLLETFNKCARYIDANRTRYGITNSTSFTIDHENPQLEPALCTIANNLKFLKSWKKNILEELKILLDHPLMQSRNFCEPSDYITKTGIDQPTISRYKNADSDFYETHKKD